MQRAITLFLRQSVKQIINWSKWKHHFGAVFSKPRLQLFWHFSAQENNECSDTQIQSPLWRLFVHSRRKAMAAVLPAPAQEVTQHSALHFHWQAFSLILPAIKPINVDRINTCVLARVPLQEIACHCRQTNIRARTLWRRGNHSTFPLRSSNNGIDWPRANHTSERNKWLRGKRSTVHGWEM